MRLTASLAAALMLAACASTPAPSPIAEAKPIAGPPLGGYYGPMEAAFICDNGVRLSVSFTDEAVLVRMEEGGEALTLSAEPAASGYSYGDGGRHQLRGQGTEAFWTVGRMAPVRCADVTFAK